MTILTSLTHIVNHSLLFYAYIYVPCLLHARKEYFNFHQVIHKYCNSLCPFVGTEDDELKLKPVCNKGRIEKMHGYHSSYNNLIKSATPELRKLFRSYESINKKIINVNWSITFNI